MGTLVETTLVALAALVVGLPALTLLHELGHGLAAALLIGGRTTVVQGPAPARLTVSLPRLELRLRGPVGPHRVWVGWAVWEAHPDVWRHALATAAGPLASGVAAAACLFGGVETRGDLRELLLLLALGAAGQLLSSGLPVRYGRCFGSYAGEASDGLRIRRLLAGAPEAPPVLHS